MFHTDHLLQVVDGGLTELGVPRTITDEQTIKFYKQQQRKDAKVMELCAVKAGSFHFSLLDLRCPAGSPRVRRSHGLPSEPGSGSGCT